ncbi:MAG: hypothetical protein CMJ83_01690 [Planctomycetes bacterium]|nr:hypothetical protein [Planctomycetota bacterium]
MKVRLDRSLFALALLLSVGLGQTPSELSARLPKSKGLVIEGDRLLLKSPGGLTYQVVDASDGNAIVKTSAGKVGVHEDILEYGRLAAIDHLPRLLEVARAARIDVDGLRLRDVLLVGAHLTGDERWVLPEGILTKKKGESAPGETEIQAAKEAIENLVASLDSRRSLSTLAKKSLASVLGVAADYTASEGAIVSPALARAVIRHDWLDKVLGKDDKTAAVRTTLGATQRIAKVTWYAGDGLVVAELEDAYESRGWLLSTPARCGYARELPPPEYQEDSRTLQLEVELPVGSDPARDAGRAIAARVSHDRVPLASWSLKDGFTADREAWRNAVPLDPSLVSNYLPPHVLLMDLRGDVLRLITPKGSVAPVEDGSPAEVERFVAEAAKALPSAAHLDLLGQFLFRYVNDSPDPAIPELIGTEDTYGEIHQTTTQTLANVTGGVCRGDCDDLAEIYHAIATRQGRIPHIMNLPAHNALGWAEKLDDDQWHTYVLQTGPPLEFKAKTIQKSLQAAYTSFGAGQGFDPNQVQIAVRFSGENLRSNWGLGWRVFVEKKYAATMIDVQRDWHFCTYHRGIAKMEQLVKDGDRDPANIHELAGLAQATGQWELASKYMREAIITGGDPLLALSAGLMANAFELERDDEALEIAKDLVHHKLSDAHKRLGEDYWPVALGIANQMLRESDEREVSVTVAHDVLRYALQIITQLDAFLTSRRFDRQVWEQDEKIHHRKNFLRGYASTLSGFFHEGGLDEIETNDRLASLLIPVELWMARIAFHDIAEPGEILDRYASIGAYYRTTMGWPALRAALDATPYPKNPKKDHQQRTASLAQIHRDLPWIKASVSFWSGQLSYLFREEAKTLDVHEVLDLATHIEAAHQQADRLAMQALVYEETLFGTRLCKALVTKNEAELRTAFRHIKKLNDTGLRDIARGWITGVARFTDVAWFRRVCELWKEEVNYKPAWFAMAWSCKIGKAPKHALVVADLAVEAFPEDAAFREEREFMKRLMGGGEKNEQGR